jgi:TolB-like protein
LIAAAALLVGLAGAGAWHWLPPQTAPIASSRPPEGTAARRLSLIVLPFENLGGDRSENYLAEGVTEDLTTDLARLPGAFVIARNTAYSFKDKPLTSRRSAASSACATCSKAACASSVTRCASTRS